MGWQVDEDGVVQKDLVSALHVTSSNFTYTAPERTTGITAKGNVKASDTGLNSFTFNFYDSLGNSYQFLYSTVQIPVTPLLRVILQQVEVFLSTESRQPLQWH